MYQNYYPFLGTCSCRKGCQGYKRMGAGVEFRIPGSTGFLADLVEWTPLTHGPGPGEGCTYNGGVAYRGYLPLMFVLQSYSLETVGWADQHSRAARLWSNRIGVSDVDPPLSIVSGVTDYIDFSDCSLPPDIPTDPLVRTGRFLTQSTIGPLIELRWLRT